MSTGQRLGRCADSDRPTLAAPVLILPSLQVNIRAGAMPPASEQGRVFLRLPVNAI